MKKKIEIDKILNDAIPDKKDFSPKKKRGRPKKVMTDTIEEKPEQSQPNFDHIEKPQPEIQPVYDTTEESKVLLRAPFEIVAIVTKVPEMALSMEEIALASPSFKVVYDKYIKPNMGEHADIIMCGVVIAQISYAKFNLYQKIMQERHKYSQEMKTDNIND